MFDLTLPNITFITEGVLDYTRKNNPAVFSYRHDVDVKEWLVKQSFEYKRGEVVGVNAEPGPLTLALQQGQPILIYDLDKCPDSEVMEMIEEEIICHPEIQFAFAVSA